MIYDEVEDVLTLINYHQTIMIPVVYRKLYLGFRESSIYSM